MEDGAIMGHPRAGSVQESPALLHRHLHALPRTPSSPIISVSREAQLCFPRAWEQRKAGEIFTIYDDRNHADLPVLSASQGEGMVLRDEMGRNISYDHSNEKNYKRVKPGSFVIHLRSFQGGFAHSPIEGIVSPAYTVFEAIDETNQCDRFWKHLFMSKRFVQALTIVTYGIRDGRSINVDEFLEMPLSYPAYPEQVDIGQTIDRLDNLITLHQRKPRCV